MSRSRVGWGWAGRGGVFTGSHLLPARASTLHGMPGFRVQHCRLWDARVHKPDPYAARRPSMHTVLRYSLPTATASTHMHAQHNGCSKQGHHHSPAAMGGAPCPCPCRGSGAPPWSHAQLPGDLCEGGAAGAGPGPPPPVLPPLPLLVRAKREGAGGGARLPAGSSKRQERGKYRLRRVTAVVPGAEGAGRG